MSHDIDEQEMDRLCWILVSQRNDFHPPDESAEQCLDTFEDVDPETVGHEYGYHSGMFIAYNMFMKQMYGYGIDVLARANRYTYANRQQGIEFRLEDEPDFYQHIERGAEEDAANSPLFAEVEIESIDIENPPYTPEVTDGE